MWNPNNDWWNGRFNPNVTRAGLEGTDAKREHSHPPKADGRRWGFWYRIQREFLRSLLTRLPALEETALTRSLVEAGAGITLPPLQVHSLHPGNEAANRQREFTFELSDSQAFVVHRVRFQGDVAVFAEFDA